MDWAYDIDLYHMFAQVIAYGEVTTPTPKEPLYYTPFTSRKWRYKYAHTVEEG
jgi:hypothetical protein